MLVIIETIINIHSLFDFTGIETISNIAIIIICLGTIPINLLTITDTLERKREAKLGQRQKVTGSR